MASSRSTRLSVLVGQHKLNLMGSVMGLRVGWVVREYLGVRDGNEYNPHILYVFLKELVKILLGLNPENPKEL